MNNPLLYELGFAQAMDAILARYVRCEADVPHMTEALRMYCSLIETDPDVRAALGISTVVASGEYVAPGGLGGFSWTVTDLPRPTP